MNDSLEPLQACDQEPIVALASGQGACAIAVLRISGSACFSLLEPFIKFKSAKKWSAGHMRLCQIVDEQGLVIDEPMVVKFDGPRSFTGQDSLEFYLHGGPYIIQQVLGLCYRQGIRAAQPGEFTRRSFLSGKLDLTAAEGIGEMVSARSKQQWLAARYLASGRLKEQIEQLRILLVEAMAWLEARIDFPDEKETSSVELKEVDQRVVRVRASVAKLLGSYDNGRVATQGLKVALVGEPNAGKSTLMNALLDEERAIVTDVAGTTRDYLDEPCLINGRLIRLIDTAGIRDVECKVERAGIERSLQKVEDADLVLFIASLEQPQSAQEQLKGWQQRFVDKQSLLILSKSDLVPIHQSEQLAKEGGHFIMSSHDEGSVERLKQMLAAKVDSYVSDLAEQSFITSVRHKAALEQAQTFIAAFFDGQAKGLFDDMLAFELQQAAKCLSSIVGVIDSEDLLDQIFSSFCVGK